MIAVKISDGLGNQLFQYCTAYSVAKKNNTGLIIDRSILDTNPIRNYEIDKFHFKYNRVISVREYPSKPLKVLMRMVIRDWTFSSYKKFDEKKVYDFDDSIFDCGEKNVYLNGYWQNYRYFDSFRSDILKMIRPAKTLSPYGVEMCKRINATDQSISVHIRRGDYVGHGELPDNYYKESMNLMRTQFSNPVFFIFSDDTSYIRELFCGQKDVVIIDNPSDSNKTIEDFLLMKTCRFHIIGNSTYSWWAAYSAKETITICPIYKSFTDSFYPVEWKRIYVND